MNCTYAQHPMVKERERVMCSGQAKVRLVIRGHRHEALQAGDKRAQTGEIFSSRESFSEGNSSAESSELQELPAMPSAFVRADIANPDLRIHELPDRLVHEDCESDLQELRTTSEDDHGQDIPRFRGIANASNGGDREETLEQYQQVQALPSELRTGQGG
jgi:hypothetical protein